MPLQHRATGIPRHRLVSALSGCALVIISALAFLPPQVFAESASRKPAGFVYVNNNTASNTVEALARANDGSLTPLAGSPFSAGGSGLGTDGLGSQGGATLSGDGKLLFVVDAGSNQISVLRVRDDGSLDPVAGSPFPSNGVRPVSVAVTDRFVFVANTGDATTQASDCTANGGGSNYTGFRLAGDSGRLTPLDHSTYCVPPGSVLGDVLISPDSKHVVGIRVGTATGPVVGSDSLIDSFELDSSGRLAAAPGSPFLAEVNGPFGSSFRPTDSSQVFVSDAHGGPNARYSLGVFHR